MENAEQSSFFSSIEYLPEDPILSLPIHFAADPRSPKVNLGIGAYKDEKGKSYVLPSVRKAEKIVFESQLDKEYLPIEGLPAFVSLYSNLIYGNRICHELGQNMCAFQAIGGAGALRIGGEFLSRSLSKKIYLSDPTWPNHFSIFRYSGMEINSYPYYNSETHEVSFDSLCAAISTMTKSSVILFHVCCHNPTGMDLSNDQWQELSSIIRKQKLFPFFDLAYQGFGKDIEQDVFPIRYFASQGHEMAVAASCAKNFGLYGERVGLLSMVTSNFDTAGKVKNYIKHLIRGNYSVPPLHGPRIVSTILQSKDLFSEWEREVSLMRTRINFMRSQLSQKLQQANLDKNFSFIEKQTGFFSFLGLNASHVERLRKEFAIYLPNNGRINAAGLNNSNIDYVVQALVKVLT